MTKESWADEKRHINFSKHPVILPPMSSLNSVMNGMVTGSPPQYHSGTTNEGPDALNKSIGSNGNGF